MIVRVLLALFALTLPAVASAQAYRCTVPRDMPRPRPDGPSVREPRRVLPIGGYTLAISWSPQHCRGSNDPDDRFQCAVGNHFGFVLHGLWPDGEGPEWPQYCAAAPLLSERVLRENMCMTPSPQLLQHEYAKHGTCMNVSPERYFGEASRLHSRIRYPDMNALSRRKGLTASQFAAAFARANRGITPAMLRIRTSRDGWLDEVWVCLDTRRNYAACPASKRGAAPTSRLKIWRT